MSSTLRAFTFFYCLLDLNLSLIIWSMANNILPLVMNFLMPLKVAFGGELAWAV